MTKSARQLLIAKLINERGVKTQEELVSLLEAEGVYVTQATISRDIKELNLVKTQRGDGTALYQKADSEHTYRMEKKDVDTSLLKRIQMVFRESVIEITSAYFLVIIKTLPGLAQGTALCIDELAIEEVAGTIAGDDTIFVAVKKEDEVEALIKRLKRLIE